MSNANTISGLLSVILFFVCGIADINSSDEIIIGFEPEEGFLAGERLLPVNLNAENGVETIISPDTSWAGAQALELKGHGTFSISVDENGDDVLFSSVSIIPVSGSKASTGTVVHLGSGSIRFSEVAEGAEIQILQHAFGSIEEWLGTGEVVGVNNDGVSIDWLQLTVRSDFEHGIWDLYLGNELVAADIAAEDRASDLVIETNSLLTTTLDEVIISGQNAMFEDADRDGLPDDWELENGLNPLVNDRYSDNDGDSLANNIEFLGGKIANVRDFSETHDHVYVDNSIGDDRQNGLSVTNLSFSGPKKSISGGCRTAKNGDTIIVMPGDSVYVENYLNLGEMNIILKPVGSVMIRPE